MAEDLSSCHRQGDACVCVYPASTTDNLCSTVGGSGVPTRAGRLRIAKLSSFKLLPFVDFPRLL
eukprot:scaffold42459_cov59-Attheya_sp.AAC.2